MRLAFLSRKSSPRKRGCFRNRRHKTGHRTVFPAQAGVFPFLWHVDRLSKSLPRASGGVSDPYRLLAWCEESSPRKRGCFLQRLYERDARGVFPAQAGVFPSATGPHTIKTRLPRASGGVSKPAHSAPHECGSSPRKRGCFQQAEAGTANDVVFPAQAGVFPTFKKYRPRGYGLPRASGGVPDGTMVVRACCASSPRKRGCFQILPSAAEIRGGLPRASGGVSPPQSGCSLASRSSPRKRGCFSYLTVERGSPTVFPAQAGVFPANKKIRKTVRSLPRASGGVSLTAAMRVSLIKVFPA